MVGLSGVPFILVSVWLHFGLNRTFSFFFERSVFERFFVGLVSTTRGVPAMGAMRAAHAGERRKGRPPDFVDLFLQTIFLPHCVG
jgi:hypothetical protein